MLFSAQSLFCGPGNRSEIVRVQSVRNLASLINFLTKHHHESINNKKKVFRVLIKLRQVSLHNLTSSFSAGNENREATFPRHLTTSSKFGNNRINYPDKEIKSSLPLREREREREGGSVCV